MRVLAIDPSLTSLGYAYTVDNGGTVHTGTIKVNPKAKSKKNPTHIVGTARIVEIHRRLVALLDDVRPVVVSYEGYASGKMYPYLLERAELGGVIKKELYERGIPIVLVPPTSLKLYATGKGNSDKEMMMLKMSEHRGEQFTCDDEADAYALLLLGLAYGSVRHRPRDPRHYKNAALKGCTRIGAD